MSDRSAFAVTRGRGRGGRGGQHGRGSGGGPMYGRGGGGMYNSGGGRGPPSTWANHAAVNGGSSRQESQVTDQIPTTSIDTSRKELSVPFVSWSGTSSPLLPSPPLPVPIEDLVPLVLVVTQSLPPVQLPERGPPIRQVYTHRQASAPPLSSSPLTDPVVDPTPAPTPSSDIDLPIALRKGCPGSPQFSKVVPSNGRKTLGPDSYSYVGPYYSSSW
ncbi:PREDICTED: WAS/WASL-interacting protein family member 1-like [Nelumbo nucifera]|uniref:WAS/WASL-interacting protein family member 1-like n=1 Tax=Nelumbo nucifera TaxID=4432 RepID=A0A1U7ZKW6_NELNU|nr:PREDICTED: WAS/WASL-interacting protein family member 1-like [Nelumbo nucifera]